MLCTQNYSANVKLQNLRKQSKLNYYFFENIEYAFHKIKNEVNRKNKQCSLPILELTQLVVKVESYPIS